MDTWIKMDMYVFDIYNLMKQFTLTTHLNYTSTNSGTILILSCFLVSLLTSLTSLSYQRSLDYKQQLLIVVKPMINRHLKAIIYHP